MRSLFWGALGWGLTLQTRDAKVFAQQMQLVKPNKISCDKSIFSLMESAPFCWKCIQLSPKEIFKDVGLTIEIYFLTELKKK